MKRYVYTLATKTPGAKCVLLTEAVRIAGRLGETAPDNYPCIVSDTLLEPAVLESAETAVNRLDTLQQYGSYLTAVAANYPGQPIARLRELGLLEDRPFA